MSADPVSNNSKILSLKNSAAKSYYEEFAPVIKLMEEGVEEGVAPGMVLLAGVKGQIIFCKAAGKRYSKKMTDTGVNDPANQMSHNTVFDVAALTSQVVTVTLVMKLVESGKLKLDDKVSRYIQGFSVLGKSRVSIGHLLSHTSGIAPTAPLYEELLKANSGARLGILTSRGARDYIINSIIRMPLKYEAGTRQVYSDLGYILLGYIVEMLTGMSLDRAAQKIIFHPLLMKTSSYIDLSMIKRRGIHPVTDLIAP